MNYKFCREPKRKLAKTESYMTQTTYISIVKANVNSDILLQTVATFCFPSNLYLKQDIG